MTNEELQIIITAQIKDLQNKLDQAEKETKDFSTKGEKALAAFSKAMASVGKATAAAMKATAAAVATGAAALAGLAESTRESRAETAKLNSAFEAVGSTAEQASETYNDLYRVLGDSGQATEAAAHLAQLSTNQEELAEWTNICQGVYATFGDSLPIESLTEAANETAKTGALTGGLADALNWAGISEEKFQEQLDACNTEAEREKLIRETLNGVYDDAAKKYEENAGSIMAANEAQAKLTAGLDALGAAVEPVMTIFKSGLGDVLQSLVPHITTIAEALQGIIQGVEGSSEKLEAGINGLVGSILGTITDLLPMLLNIGVNIITALLNGIVKAFPSIVKTIATLLPQLVNTIITVIPQITEAVLGALPLLLETLLTIINSILVGLTEMLPMVIEQIVSIIPVLINTLLENIPLLLETALTLLTAIIDAILEFLPVLIEALPQIIDTICDVLFSNIPLILDTAVEIFLAIIDAIPEILPALIDALPDIIDSIVLGLLDAIPDILNAAVKLFFALVDAVPKIIPSLLKAIGNLLLKLIASVGKAFFKLGEVVGESLTGAIKQSINWILSKVVGMINTFISGINWAIGIINKIPGVEIGKLSKLDVPQFARGGVVDSATLGVFGEAGAEAVVPLENNLEWLDKLAGMLNERMGGGIGAPVYLQVDGKTFAEISVDTINQLTRQRGSLPLVVV